MHVAHPVRDGWQTWLTDDTLVCRCEEVTVAGLTSAVDDLGATDARTAKLLSRCGMGWCQGRMCGEAVSRVVSARTGADPRRTADRLAADLAGTANRPVAAPITLGLLAQPPTPTGGPHV
ncbi:(2Fe-2S)-binding protein [Kineosporia sp. R_H_3]|uniref:(2Fe-2S)-binding protein n=1 Tax=Kineosporia sp. R_H_3 TaxID=1961848 RepID=UPI0018E99F20|nr:(2Fe-2S)-binding protein [Kineosporia sp. R_H_3]